MRAPGKANVYTIVALFWRQSNRNYETMSTRLAETIGHETRNLIRNTPAMLAFAIGSKILAATLRFEASSRDLRALFRHIASLDRIQSPVTLSLHRNVLLRNYCICRSFVVASPRAAESAEIRFGDRLKRLRTWRTHRIEVERRPVSPWKRPGNDSGGYPERHCAISARLLATRCFRAPPALDVHRTAPELITGASCLTVNGTRLPRLPFWKRTRCPPSASRRPAAFRSKVGRSSKGERPIRCIATWPRKMVAGADFPETSDFRSRPRTFREYSRSRRNAHVSGNLPTYRLSRTSLRRIPLINHSCGSLWFGALAKRGLEIRDKRSTWNLRINRIFEK